MFCGDFKGFSLCFWSSEMACFWGLKFDIFECHFGSGMSTHFGRNLSLDKSLAYEGKKGPLPKAKGDVGGFVGRNFR